MADLPPALSQAPAGPQGRLTRQIALSRASPSDGGALGPQTGRPQSTFFNSDMKPGVFMVPRAAGSMLKNIRTYSSGKIGLRTMFDSIRFYSWTRSRPCELLTSLFKNKVCSRTEMIFRIKYSCIFLNLDHTFFTLPVTFPK